jgi:hypothetical protein
LSGPSRLLKNGVYSGEDSDFCDFDIGTICAAYFSRLLGVARLVLAAF